jgi:hypothetical protein
MIIDTHTHVWSFPSYRDLSQHIKTTETSSRFARAIRISISAA